MMPFSEKKTYNYFKKPCSACVAPWSNANMAFYDDYGYGENAAPQVNTIACLPRDRMLLRWALRARDHSPPLASPLLSSNALERIVGTKRPAHAPSRSCMRHS